MPCSCKHCVLAAVEHSGENRTPKAFEAQEKYLSPVESALASPPHSSPPALWDLTPQWPSAWRGQKPSWVTQKVSGRETRPSHSGNLGSSPALNHRPPCLFPSPRATSVCVYALTTWLTQTRLSAPPPDPLLVPAPGTSQQCHRDLALFIGRCGQPQTTFTNTRVWGRPEFGPQPPGQPNIVPHSPATVRDRGTVRQAHRVRGLGLDPPASQLERPRGSGPGDDRDRRRDGERAPETQKKPTLMSWPHAQALALSALSGPLILFLPPSPATCTPAMPSTQNLKEKVPVHTSVTCGGGVGRGREGDWQRWRSGELELKNTLNTSPLQPPPMSPVPEAAAGGNPDWGGELSNHRITQAVSQEPGLPGTYHLTA